MQYLIMGLVNGHALGTAKYTDRQVEAFRSDPEILEGLISITLLFYVDFCPRFCLQPPYRMQADPEAPAITQI